MNLDEFIAECDGKIEEKELKAVMNGVKVNIITPKVNNQEEPLPTLSLKGKPSLLQAQKDDKVIKTVTTYIEQERRPSKEENAKLDPEVKLLLKEWNKLFMNKNGIL